MRTEEDVLQRFRDAYDKVLRERREKFLSTSFMNCRFNVRHRLKKHGMVGFCQNSIVTAKARHGAAICNDDCVAAECSMFECRHSEESVREDLNNVMKNPNQCGQEYPKLAVLLWFLQKDNPGSSRMSRAFGCLADAVNSFWAFVTLRWW